MDDDLTPDEEAAMLVALLRWRVSSALPVAADDAREGMDQAASPLDGCKRNDLIEVVADARSHR